MNIAIIGAGLAGLACAHELERHGIHPDIYEDLDYIGDREAHISAVLEIADRPFKDALQYSRDVLRLDIKPVNIIKQIRHIAPNTERVIRSRNFGYFIKRGTEPDSIKRQLASQLTGSRIILGSKPDYKALSREYDNVVVATNHPDAARELGCWDNALDGRIKGAVVTGSFDPYELIIWLNRNYSKSGYVYLCPYDDKRATLALFAPFVTPGQLEYYWRRFLTEERIQYKILEEFSVQHFSGNVYPHRADNVYLAGGAGGGISAFLGFGTLDCMSMGFYAAQAMIQGLDYEGLLETIVKKLQSSLTIRKVFNRLTNKNFNTVIELLCAPVIKQLAYHTPINVMDLTAAAIRMKYRL